MRFTVTADGCPVEAFPTLAEAIPAAEEIALRRVARRRSRFGGEAVTVTIADGRGRIFREWLARVDRRGRPFIERTG